MMNRHAILLSCLLFPLGACSSTGASTTPAAPAGETAAASATDVQRPGFEVLEVEGRLLVFRSEDPLLAKWKREGDLIQSVTRIGAGPGGRTVRAPDAGTIDSYVLSRPGFTARVVDGRVWVFEAGSKAWNDFITHGEPTVSVTRIGVGPGGMTVRSSDGKVIDAWLAGL